MSQATAPGEGALFYPTVSTPLFSAMIEESDLEDQEVDDTVDEEHDEESEEVDLESPPFPIKQLPEWELRHARRRGSESSYRHQRKNQFYPIYIDETERLDMQDERCRSKVLKATTAEQLNDLYEEFG